MAEKPVKREQRETFPMSPFDFDRPLAAFQREVNRLFGDFWSGFDADALRPGMDVSETDDAVVVTAELPGVKEDDLEVSLSGGVLHITGEKRREHEDKKKNYYVTERAYGRIDRAIRLPTTVDENKVSATFKDGVLTIEAPKAEAAKPKKIALKKS